ncbi:MAG: type VI secretion system baseplate subunit TssG [Granulosicoccus sp.]|nr:type VI secretion system baseplate subunit TssG [Granulosicoccus sp.]
MSCPIGDKTIAIDSPTAPDAPDSLLPQLTDDLHQFDFVSVIRALECRHLDKPRQGYATRLADEKLRLSQRPTTGFQGRALESFEIQEKKLPYRLYCNFFGLLGSNGPLPLHYTEYADQRTRHHNDPTFQEFLDLFHNRMLSLFYKATVMLDPAINHDRPASSRFVSILGSLSGRESASARNRDTVPDYAKLYYAGWMGNQAKSPEGISSMVSDYFSVGCSVKEFVGDWLPLPASSLAKLGRSRSEHQLGVSLYIGRRVWSIGHKFVVSLGPLNWEEYLSFRPGSARARELRDLIRNYVGDEWAWDLEFIIQRNEVEALKLDRQCRLGFSSFLAQNLESGQQTRSVKVNSQTLTHSLR